MICTEEFGSHEYSEKTCQKCGEDFCFSCCKSTNVHEGGKYEEDYMLCPTCGHNWYENTVDPYRKENKKTNGMELNNSKETEDWVKEHPGTRTFVCIWRGIYDASIPMCTECEEET